MTIEINAALVKRFRKFPQGQAGACPRGQGVAKAMLQATRMIFGDNRLLTIQLLSVFLYPCTLVTVKLAPVYRVDLVHMRFDWPNRTLLT